jgi:hypothetical protein
VRWLAWESAHWDAESCGMVAFEKSSKSVLGLALAELPAWRDALAAKDAAMEAFLESRRGGA